ncbi:hypothetical protein HK098_007707, partial [Nowakowskiella sp. JEL0407]
MSDLDEYSEDSEWDREMLSAEEEAERQKEKKEEKEKKAKEPKPNITDGDGDGGNGEGGESEIDDKSDSESVDLSDLDEDCRTVSTRSGLTSTQIFHLLDIYVEKTKSQIISKNQSKWESRAFELYHTDRFALSRREKELEGYEIALGKFIDQLKMNQYTSEQTFLKACSAALDQMLNNICFVEWRMKNARGSRPPAPIPEEVKKNKKLARKMENSLVDKIRNGPENWDAFIDDSEVVVVDEVVDEVVEESRKELERRRYNHEAREQRKPVIPKRKRSESGDVTGSFSPLVANTTAKEGQSKNARKVSFNLPVREASSYASSDEFKQPSTNKPSFRDRMQSTTRADVDDDYVISVTEDTPDHSFNQVSSSSTSTNFSTPSLMPKKTRVEPMRLENGPTQRLIDAGLAEYNRFFNQEIRELPAHELCQRLKTIQKQVAFHQTPTKNEYRLLLEYRQFISSRIHTFAETTENFTSMSGAQQLAKVNQMWWSLNEVLTFLNWKKEAVKGGYVGNFLKFDESEWNKIFKVAGEVYEERMGRKKGEAVASGSGFVSGGGGGKGDGKRKRKVSVVRKRRMVLSDSEDGESESDVSGDESGVTVRREKKKGKFMDSGKGKSVSKERDNIMKQVERRAKKQEEKMREEGIEDVMINIGHGNSEEDIFIPRFISDSLKKHQIEGVQYMWTSIMIGQKLRSGKLTYKGCILADAMGLGKTLQVITLLYTLSIAIEEKAKLPEHLL